MGELTVLTDLWLNDNAGLCGDVVSVGTVTTSYDTSGTALGTACPTASPTAPSAAPTATRSPTSNKPCCDTLRENPVWCCIEPTLSAAAVARACQEC